MNSKLWRFAAALLPICLLSAQQPNPQSLQQSNQVPPQPNQGSQQLIVQYQQPSPEVMRQIAERWQRAREHANAINDAASHIQSLDDARKLVNLVADEFSDELPPKWITHSIRERIARAEYESAADPGSLIPDQHIADVWNDFVEKIGAPQETMLNAAEIHYLRDGQYVSARLSWSRGGGGQQIWTIPGVFALGPDGKVANGSRALEAIRLVWLLGNSTDDFAGIHSEAQKGVLLSDLIAHPEKPPAPGTATGYMTARIVSFPVQQAANRYMHDHGARALNNAVEGLLKSLIAD
jgi:hypothetical protein